MKGNKNREMTCWKEIAGIKSILSSVCVHGEEGRRVVGGEGLGG